MLSVGQELSIVGEDYLTIICRLFQLSPLTVNTVHDLSAHFIYKHLNTQETTDLFNSTIKSIIG